MYYRGRTDQKYDREFSLDEHCQYRIQNNLQGYGMTELNNGKDDRK